MRGLSSEVHAIGKKGNDAHNPLTRHSFDVVKNIQNQSVPVEIAKGLNLRLSEVMYAIQTGTYKEYLSRSKEMFKVTKPQSLP